MRDSPLVSPKPGDPKTYHVNINGHVTTLLGVPSFRQILFTTGAGFALVTQTTDGAYRVRRYTDAKTLAWSKDFPKGGSFPSIALDDDPNVDLRVQHGRWHRYSRDGDEIGVKQQGD
ncbi:MAG: hypothetical protein GY794_02545 [bacterium]|nr:hypothetical protein [bacterium]